MLWTMSACPLISLPISGKIFGWLNFLWYSISFRAWIWSSVEWHVIFFKAYLLPVLRSSIRDIVLKPLKKRKYLSKHKNPLRYNRCAKYEVADNFHTKIREIVERIYRKRKSKSVMKSFLWKHLMIHIEIDEPLERRHSQRKAPT